MKPPIRIVIASIFIAMAVAVDDNTYSMILIGMSAIALISATLLINELRLIKQEHIDRANMEGWIDFTGTENPFTVNTEVEYFTDSWKHNIVQMSDKIVWKNVAQYKVKV